jgi:hypothetical protein
VASSSSDGSRPERGDDAVAISKVLHRLKEAVDFEQNALGRTDDGQRLARLVADIRYLETFAGLNASSQRLSGKIRAMRILRYWFGWLGALYISEIFAERSGQPQRLLLRPRKPHEYPDWMEAIHRRTRREIKDAKFHNLVMLRTRDGLPLGEAIDDAIRELKYPASREAAQKVLSRARRDARARGYTDPLAPAVQFLLGGSPDEPAVNLADLRRAGRPRKNPEK